MNKTFLSSIRLRFPVFDMKRWGNCKGKSIRNEQSIELHGNFSRESTDQDCVPNIIA